MKPEQYFEQSLREKYAAAQKATVACIQTFLTNQSEPNKKQRAEEAYYAVLTLHDLLPDNHRPTWLVQLRNHLNTVRQSPFGSSSLPAATSIATQLFPQMQRHNWKFTDADQNGFDFDQIFEMFREQNRIPELFDEIVGWLQQIVDSGQIAIAQYWWTPCGAARIRKGRKPNVNEWKTCSPQFHGGVQA